MTASFFPLLRVLVGRDLKSRYRNSALGFLWVLAHPLLLMAVLSLVFGLYARIETPVPYPAFLFCGLLPWAWISGSLVSGARSLMDGSSLLKKSAFAPEVLPAAVAASHALHFLFSLPVLALFLWGFGIRPGLAAAWLVPLAALQFLFCQGLALSAALGGVRFRDLVQALESLLSLGFFLTPITYPPSLVPERFRWTVELNPAAALIGGYRAALLENRAPPLSVWLVAGGWAAAALAFGRWQFRRAGRRFVAEL